FLIYNHIKKSIWSKTGFALFPDAFENYWKFFTFDHPKYQLDSLSYQKQGPLFKIEALLLLQNVVTDTKKKTHTHIIYALQVTL
ncbi:Sec23 trunk domain-containing protein, partial [Aphis craccivora]